MNVKASQEYCSILYDYKTLGIMANDVLAYTKVMVVEI